MLTLQVAGITFDRHHHDKRGDVLYLNVGAPRPAVRSLEINDGHAVHYDESDSVVGLTLLNAKRLIDKKGCIDLVIPITHLVPATSFREVFALG